MDIFRFILHENDNLIAYGNLDNDKVEIELKPNCDKKVKEMWELLNKPYDTKILHKSK